jgi:hypothetical protein
MDGDEANYDHNCVFRTTIQDEKALDEEVKKSVPK